MAETPATQFKHVFTHESPGKIEDYYTMGKILGEGSYGSVKIATDKSTEASRAIKCIKLSAIKDPKRFDIEIAIQKELDHPNIVKLYDVFKDNKMYYLALELCTGGELFDRIVEETGKKEEVDEAGAFDEEMAARYMQQILGAMRYIHGHHFVHRDIKPENFLMQNKSPEAPIKVIDFGLATRYEGTPMKTKAGTPYYVAPQVLAGSYDEKCDIWSCGVIMYILLCGYPPFTGDDDNSILRKVKKGDIEFDDADWSTYSAQSKDLIRQMLTMNPAARPSAEKCLEHPWLLDHSPKAKGKLAPNLSTRLTEFRVYSRLKKVALTAIAQQMRAEDIEEMTKTFELLDANHDGMLTVEEITQGMQKHKIDLPDGFKSVLTNLDTDGSGQIDYTEFIAATLQHKQYQKEEILWAAFRTFDLNGDGEITRDELKQLLQTADDKIITDMVGEVDTDGDGAISFEEFCVMMGMKKEDIKKHKGKSSLEHHA